MELPKISVVTISYNQKEFLAETIDSVLSQNYPNLEYIIIDGGSTDGSIELIKRYEDQLSYWVSEPDKGPANALNKGFQKATGSIYFYLNSDDIVLPGAFKTAADLFTKNPSYDIYHGHGYISDVNLENRIKIFTNKWNSQLFSKGMISIIQPSTFFDGGFYRENLLFNEANRTCWDAEILALAAAKDARFYRINKHLSVFRFHTNSITGGVNEALNIKYEKDKKRMFQLALKNKNSKIPGVLLGAYKFLNDPVISFQRLTNDISPITKVRDDV